MMWCTDLITRRRVGTHPQVGDVVRSRFGMPDRTVIAIRNGVVEYASRTRGGREARRSCTEYRWESWCTQQRATLQV